MFKKKFMELVRPKMALTQQLSSSSCSSSAGYNDGRSLSDYTESSPYDELPIANEDKEDFRQVLESSSYPGIESDNIEQGASPGWSGVDRRVYYRSGPPPELPARPDPKDNDPQLTSMAMEDELAGDEEEPMSRDSGLQSSSGINNNDYGCCDSTTTEAAVESCPSPETEPYYQPLIPVIRQRQLSGRSVRNNFTKQPEAKKRIRFEMHVDYKKLAKVTAVIIDVRLSNPTTADSMYARSGINFENFKSTEFHIYEGRGDITVSVKDVQWARDVHDKSLEKRIVALESLWDGIDCPIQFSQECKPGRLQSGRLKLDTCVEQKNTTPTTLSLWCDLGKMHEVQKKSICQSSSIASRDNKVVLRPQSSVYTIINDTSLYGPASHTPPSQISPPPPPPPPKQTQSQPQIPGDVYSSTFSANPLVDNYMSNMFQYRGNRQPQQAVPASAAGTYVFLPTPNGRGLPVFLPTAMADVYAGITSPPAVATATASHPPPIYDHMRLGH